MTFESCKIISMKLFKRLFLTLSYHTALKYLFFDNFWSLTALDHCSTSLYRKKMHFAKHSQKKTNGV